MHSQAQAETFRKMILAMVSDLRVVVVKLAALALFLCRDDAGSITGANLSMDGGWTAA